MEELGAQEKKGRWILAKERTHSLSTPTEVGMSRLGLVDSC